MRDRFFEKENCDRCGLKLGGARMMSWFTNNTLCMECIDKEDKIKEKLREQGKKPSDFEGCGYIPEV